MVEAVTYADLLSAQHRLRGHAVETPLLESPALNRLAGRRVLVKAECLQRTGAFKFRGAWNRLSALSEQPGWDSRKGGVVAFSSGNHGQAVAHAASLLGLPAVVVMPADAPQFKITATRSWGAEVVLYDRQRESREAIGRALMQERDAVLVPPFDDPYVIAGQGTAGLEILAQAQAKGISKADVLINCSGGGLSAGCALALDGSGLRVRTVEPVGFDDMARSLASGERQRNSALSGSICDAILSPEPGELTLPILQKRAGPGLAVSDDQVLAAMRAAFETLRLVLEPGGAASLAAVLSQPQAIGDDVVIVLASGGNVDPAMFIRALG